MPQVLYDTAAAAYTYCRKEDEGAVTEFTAIRTGKKFPLKDKMEP